MATKIQDKTANGEEWEQVLTYELSGPIGAPETDFVLKMHKMRYFEYVDDEGVTRHTVLKRETKSISIGQAMLDGGGELLLERAQFIQDFQTLTATIWDEIVAAEAAADANPPEGT